MKYTVARLSFVAGAAAIVGLFVGLVVYFTLLAALIFLLLATVVAVAIKLKGRKRAQGSLESAEMPSVQRLKRGGDSEHSSPPHNEDQR